MLIYSRRPDTPSETELNSLLPEAVRRIEIAMMREISPFADIRAVWSLRSWIRTLEPDVVHLHSSKAGALGRLAMLGLGLRRTFYSPRGVAFLHRGVGRYGPAFYKWLEWFLARLGGHVVAVSESERKTISSELHLRSVKLLENAVEVAVIPPKAQKTRVDGKITVVTVGRISDQKAPWRFAELSQRLHDVCDFIWIGEGEGKKQWLEGTPVNVTGWLTVTEVRNAVADADVFVLLSQYEGLPIALVESQVAGLPAVVTNVVGNTDVVEHGITGFLVETVEDAARQLTKLANDPAMRAMMGEAAARSAQKRFDSAALARRSIEVYGLQATKTIIG